MKKQRMYKCLMCGGIFEKFGYKYDSSPNGEDETYCPCCGIVEGWTEAVDVVVAVDDPTKKGDK